MSLDLPTTRRWLTAWYVTRPSMRPSVVSCVIPQRRRSNPSATHRTSLISTQIEMPSWTSPPARFVMEWGFAAGVVTSHDSYDEVGEKLTTETRRVLRKRGSALQLLVLSFQRRTRSF